MENLIDESGTFAVRGASENSWCTIAAYACPIAEKKKYRSILKVLKRREGAKSSDEIKLGQIAETNYFKFLQDMNELNGILFSVATDSGLNYEQLVKTHQKEQLASMMENIHEMKYQSGKEAIKLLVSQMEHLPAQLYIQLTCQIQLMCSFVDRGICYYVQRHPNALRNFRWKIDQKDPQKKSAFEDAFEKFCPALLQTFSLKKPFPSLNWCDYRPMEKYLYKTGSIPGYLLKKFPHLQDKEGFNIQKIIRDDIEFIDSKAYQGIQIADLLASGLRKLLHSGYEENEKAAHLLGKLMVQGTRGNPPIELLTFGSAKKVDGSLAELIKILKKSCKPMIKK